MFEYKTRGISVAAASADPLERAREVADGLTLQFPLGYGLDAPAVAERFHLTLGRDSKFVQPAAFVLKPDRTIAVAVVSTWAIGRLRPDEVFGAIHYLGKS